MAREILRDAHGDILGYIEDYNSERRLLDKHSRPLAYYDPAANVTRDAHRRLVGHGDLMARFLPGG